MKAINPATEQVIHDYPEHDEQELHKRLDAAWRRSAHWRQVPFAERTRMMREAAVVLRRRQARWAQLMTEEMGKTIASAEAEVEKCAVACDYFAEHAERFLAAEPIASDAQRSYVRYDPLGPVLAIMPWNFPFWQVFRFAAPALMAGNVGLLKHASNVPGTALAIEEVFREAGFPAGAFTTLLVGSSAIAALIANPIIRAVTLTGSESAGMSVASAAGKAIKKTVLELGGSDPFIVLDDVDVPTVAKAAASARCINAGQSCIAAKRFLVHQAIAGEFEEQFAQAMKSLRIGDPMDRGNDLGPMARGDLLEDLDKLVRQSIEQGAKLLCGGLRLPQRGYYYEPTVLGNVRPGMAAFDEETFGPVATVSRFASLDEAVELANHSRFGLGASIWTGNLPQAEALAARIDSGCVFINGPVKSDPRLPFGGVKHSGYGRELSQVGIREFVNQKTVWAREVQHPRQRPPQRSE